VITYLVRRFTIDAICLPLAADGVSHRRLPAIVALVFAAMVGRVRWARERVRWTEAGLSCFG